MRHLLLLLVTLLIGISATTTGAAPADGVVADFENTASQKITTTGLSITESKTGAAAGVGYISLSSAADAAAGKAELRLPLPAGADPAGHEKLSVALRAPQAA